MNILGVGPLELLFILLIALVVLGPKDMAKTGRTLGRFMYRVITSPAWQTFRQASKDLRQLPTKLMREAGLEEQELQKLTQEIGLKDINLSVGRLDQSLTSWTTAPEPAKSPSAAPETSAPEAASTLAPVPEAPAEEPESSASPSPETASLEPPDSPSPEPEIPVSEPDPSPEPKTP